MRYIQNTIQELLMCNKPIILVDVDGVMQDNQHRLPHICEIIAGVECKKRKADWETYTSLAHLDAPGGFCDVVRTLVACGSVQPVYLTARADSDKDRRRALLEERLAQLTGDEYPIIIKRHPLSPGERYAPATAFKQQATMLLLDAGIRILFAVDDSHRNCVMFAKLGIPTLRFYNHLIPERMMY